MMGTKLTQGDRISVKYPTHGRLNVLRDVNGVVDRIGKGPKGPFITVVEDNGNIRSLSTCKIVQM